MQKFPCARPFRDDMLVQRGFGEIALELTDEQYRKLCNR
jgi:hypothetical protein